MNKRDLVSRIAAEAKLTRAQAARALDVFVSSVQGCLLQGGRVTISGFGSFAVSVHKARAVRDPRHGTPMLIEERRIPRFAPGLEFKTAINTGDNK